MSERFFVEEGVREEEITLRGDEARHLLKVMRLQLGDELTLFDGSGQEFTAALVAADRQSATCRVESRLAPARESQRHVTLAVALPKGDRQRWLVEKIVELGVAELVPLEARRSVAKINANALERLRRGVIEASKQCGRNLLMRVADPQPAIAWLKGCTTASRLLANFGGEPFAPATQDQQHVVAAIGPEGGWAEEEIAAAAGWQAVSLGPRVLRVETAACKLAALLCD